MRIRVINGWAYIFRDDGALLLVVEPDGTVATDLDVRPLDVSDMQRLIDARPV